MTETRSYQRTSVLPRLWRFFRKPWREKTASFYSRWTHVFRRVPVPIRLPFGVWFLARNDYPSAAMVNDGFEPAEQAFVSRFLRPGMTVLDIGAHHGFYTLLASKLVGPAGKVIAFEPSPREQRALHLNISVNRCKNVSIHRLALGRKEGESNLYIVDQEQTGCNSLRPPAVTGTTSPVLVQITSLDRWLVDHPLGSVHFVKLDVEGGELSVLEGAENFLQRWPRPVLLVEVQDIRTGPWGYPARKIIEHLSRVGYSWFSINSNGSLKSVGDFAETIDGNFVAWPPELDANFGGE